MTAYQIRPLCRNRFPDLLLRTGRYHRMSGGRGSVGREVAAELTVALGGVTPEAKSS
jgi:hypothetical protein